MTVTPSEPPGLTVVIPAFNEEAGLEQTITALRAALTRHPGPVELIVVDDGSTDGTASVASRTGARTIRHPARGGYGRALKSGIAAASHELIAICDADGTYPVEALPTMVARMDHFDMVVGQRTGFRYRRKLLLSPLRTSFLLLAAFVTGSWIPDPNSGLRVFRRSIVLPLLPRLPRAFSFTTTLTLILTLSGCFVAYHPIAYHRRIGRSKVRLVRDALRAGQTMVEVVLEHNPLKMFLVVALPLGVAALTCGVFAWFDARGVVPAVALFCASVGTFVAGMLAVVIGAAGRRSR